MLHVGLNKPEYYLSNRDIPGSWPSWNKFVTTRKPSNPLCPEYKLASFEYIPPEPVAFKRDPLAVDDIDGARPVQKREYGPRRSLQTADIGGATPKVAYYKKTPHNYIDYGDVTKGAWVSSRHTNPLDPIYAHADESSGHFTKAKQMGGVNTSYGTIAGSKPASLPAKKDLMNRTIGTADIQGAQADTKNCGAFTWMKRRQVRQINMNDDIDGCKAGTLKKCFSSKRNVNPLDPAYQILGNSEGFDLMNDPYGQATSSMGIANFKKAQEEGVKKMMSAASEKVISKASD